MTAAQIRWASTHDWFIRDNGDGSIEVRDVWCHNGTRYETTATIRDWTELRLWAGY